MNKLSHLKTHVKTCLMLVALLSYVPVSAHAVTVVPNWTSTSFDAQTGNLSFNWDQNSQYEITGTSVTLNIDDIVTSGPRVAGSLYEFVIPNFYDPLPMKKINISMQGANEGASGFSLPAVLDIIGADSDYNNGGPALPVFGSFVSGTTSPTMVTEYWEMFPNPDFEIVKLYVPVEFELQNISIYTESTVVPVPAAVWLFGSGLLGLVGMARRKRS